MPVKIITPVSTEPVSLADLQTHLRLDTVAGVHPDDAMIQAQLSAARELAEQYTGRSLAPQTLELALDSFPSGSIILYGAPVTSITTIKYIDTNNVEITLSNTAYTLNDYGVTPKVEMAFNTPWPDTQIVANAVKIRYVAGYTTIPKVVKSALLLMVGHLYENRQEVVTGMGIRTDQIPFGIKSLLNTVDTMAV